MYHNLASRLLRSRQDHSMFIISTQYDQVLLLLLLHVDDVIIIGDDAYGFQFKKHHLQQFQINDPGPIRYFLGLDRSLNGISLSEKYNSNILDRVAIIDDKIVDTPLQLLTEPTR